MNQLVDTAMLRVSGLDAPEVALRNLNAATGIVGAVLTPIPQDGEDEVGAIAPPKRDRTLSRAVPGDLDRLSIPPCHTHPTQAALPRRPHLHEHHNQRETSERKEVAVGTRLPTRPEPLPHPIDERMFDYVIR
jgi:hypothetical protein